jgi:hypothetical protein
MSLATGRDLFYDRPLDEVKTPADRIYTALTGDLQGLSPTAKVAAGLIPGTQVPMAFAGTLLDDRIKNPLARAAKAGLNVSSGLKVNTQTKESEIYDINQKIAKELAPVDYTFQKHYIPKELEPTLTYRQRKLNALAEEKGKQAVKLKKRRRRVERTNELLSQAGLQ